MTPQRCDNCLHDQDSHRAGVGCFWEGEGGQCPCEAFEPEAEELIPYPETLTIDQRRTHALAPGERRWWTVTPMTPPPPDSLGRSALTLLVALLGAGAWGLVALLIAS